MNAFPFLDGRVGRIPFIAVLVESLVVVAVRAESRDGLREKSTLGGAVDAVTVGAGPLLDRRVGCGPFLAVLVEVHVVVAVRAERRDRLVEQSSFGGAMDTVTVGAGPLLYGRVKRRPLLAVIVKIPVVVAVIADLRHGRDKKTVVFRIVVLMAGAASIVKGGMGRIKPFTFFVQGGVAVAGETEVIPFRLEKGGASRAVRIVTPGAFAFLNGLVKIGLTFSEIIVTFEAEGLCHFRA